MREQGDEGERIARLEQELEQSQRDRDAIHQELGALQERVRSLSEQLTMAKAGLWLLTALGALAGFIAGTIQTYIGPHH